MTRAGSYNRLRNIFFIKVVCVLLLFQITRRKDTMIYLDNLRMCLIRPLNGVIINNVKDLYKNGPDSIWLRIYAIAMRSLYIPPYLVLYGIGKGIPNAICLGDKELGRWFRDGRFAKISHYQTFCNATTQVAHNPEINNSWDQLLKEIDDLLATDADKIRDKSLEEYLICTWHALQSHKDIQKVEILQEAMKQYKDGTNNAGDLINTCKQIIKSLTGEIYCPWFEGLLEEYKKELIANVFELNYIDIIYKQTFIDLRIGIKPQAHYDGLATMDVIKKFNFIEKRLCKWILCEIFSDRQNIVDYFYAKFKEFDSLEENIRLDIVEILSQAGIDENEMHYYYYDPALNNITKKGVEKMLESMGVIKKDSEIMKGFFVRVALVGSIAMLIFLKKKYGMVSPIEGVKKIIRMSHKVT